MPGVAGMMGGCKEWEERKSRNAKDGKAGKVP